MEKEVKIVNIDEVEGVTPFQCKVEGFKVKRLITRGREESNRLMLGVCLMEPNAKGYEWIFDNNDEVYYILKGRIKLHWEGKTVEAKEGDAVFLPEGMKYTLDNADEAEPAMLVYVLTPPAE